MPGRTCPPGLRWSSRRNFWHWPDRPAGQPGPHGPPSSRSAPAVRGRGGVEAVAKVIGQGAFSLIELLLLQRGGRLFHGGDLRLLPGGLLPAVDAAPRAQPGPAAEVARRPIARRGADRSARARRMASGDRTRCNGSYSSRSPAGLSGRLRTGTSRQSSPGRRSRTSAPPCPCNKPSSRQGRSASASARGQAETSKSW